MDYLATDRCRLRFLREQLDDPHVADEPDCGRCDNCGGLDLGTDVAQAQVADADRTLHRPGVPFEPRRMWPSAMPNLGVDVRGRIDAAHQPRTGRAIARFTDLALGQSVRAAAGEQAADAPLPDVLLRAAVQVLAAWDWERRPEVVVHVGSHRHPQLVADTAARLGELGRLAHVGALEHRGPSGRGRTNSAFRLRDVWPAYRLPDDVAAQVAGRSVLLVDDVTDTGWTLTVVAAAAAPWPAPSSVHPFVLGIAG